MDERVAPPPSACPAGHGRGGGCAGAERYLTTFADLMSLMLVFFIVMYAISQVNQAKLVELSQSIQQTFRFKSKKIGTGMPTGPSTTESEDFQQVSKIVERTARSAGAAPGITQTLTQKGLIISFSDSLFFEPGSVELRPAGQQLVAKVVQAMATRTLNDIRIEGHTDDTPYSAGELRSNWELSAMRAAAVARYITASGIVKPLARISVGGYGEHYPIVANNNPLNKARNRRVDVVLMSSQFGDQEPNIRYLRPLSPVVEKWQALGLTPQVRMENMPLITPGAEEGQ